MERYQQPVPGSGGGGSWDLKVDLSCTPQCPLMLVSPTGFISPWKTEPGVEVWHCVRPPTPQWVSITQVLILLLRRMAFSFLTSCGFILKPHLHRQAGFTAGPSGAPSLFGVQYLTYYTGKFPRELSRPFWNKDVKGREGSPPSGQRRDLRLPEHMEPCCPRERSRVSSTCDFHFVVAT